MGQNIAPNAIYETDKAEITLPDNKFRLSLAKSKDPNPKGVIEKWYHEQEDGPPCSIITPNSSDTDGEASTEGVYVFRGSVTDRGGKTGTATVTITVKPAIVVPPPPVGETIFGGKVQNDKVENQIGAANLLAFKSIRPSALPMDTYTGLPSNFMKLFNAGFIPILNVSWTNTSGDNIVPFVSGANLVTYKSKFTKFCEDVKNVPGLVEQIIVSIGNEPLNRGYYSGPVGDYIAQLRASVEIAAAFGIKVVSGGLHLELVELALNGASGDSRIADTKAIMDAEKTMAVYATNVHDGWKEGRGYSVKDIPALIKRLSAYTGHPVGNNEVSTLGASPEIIKEFVAICRAAGYIYVNWWSGDVFNGAMLPGGNSKGDALNNGLTLSANGVAFRDAIK